MSDQSKPSQWDPIGSHFSPLLRGCASKASPAQGQDVDPCDLDTPIGRGLVQPTRQPDFLRIDARPGVFPAAGRNALHLGEVLDRFGERAAAQIKNIPSQRHGLVAETIVALLTSADHCQPR